jgi:hypothetical protein
VADAFGGRPPPRSSSNAPGEAAAPSCGGFVMPNPPSAGLPNPAVYVDNGDGTITEQVSGLTWQATVADMGLVQMDALASCAAKGPGWRLPTRLELVSLVDYTISAPGPTINALFKDTPPTEFWTSTPYYGNVGDAWAIGFDVGYSDYGVVNNPDYVRCVLPPTPTCVPTRYESHGGGVVLDHATGLTWQQTNDVQQYSWPDAKKYCAARGAGWRVPSLTELQTILDDALEYPAIDQSVFPNTPHDDFWTSTPEAEGTGSAWYVDFFYGASDTDVPTRVFYVRCVR